MKKRYIAFLLLIISSLYPAQEKDAEKIIEEARKVYLDVEDYKVNAEITVELNFLNVPKSRAAIYYKQPDKLKIKSEGFALFPKEGLNFTPGGLLDENISPIYVREDTVDGYVVDVIKVVPLSDSASFILSTVWLDKEKNILRKAETTTKKNGTARIDLSYDEKSEYGLPSEIVFSFNVKDIRMPRMPGEAEENDRPKKKDKDSGGMNGKVIIKYSDYKVNTGIDDSVFEEKKENK